MSIGYYRNIWIFPESIAMLDTSLPHASCSFNHVGSYVKK
jgi:hypothetical protein